MKDLNGFTLGVTLDDGYDINVDIQPVTVDIDGSLTATGVYNLFNDDTRESLGQICFNVEDSHDWMYIDEQLSSDEAEQIALAIQKED
jgi:hypothetical protein